MRKSVLTAILLSFSAFAMAQSTRFTVTADTLQIKIGEAIPLHLKAQIPPQSTVVWPQFQAADHRQLALIDSSAIDTIKEADRWILQQTWRLTSFDSGMAQLQPLRLLGPTDTLLSDSLSFYVSFPAETEAVDFYDLKAPLDVALTWWERFRWYIILAATLLFFFLLWKYRARLQTKSKDQPVVQPLAPAHEVALEALAALEAEKVWQSGDYKAYYSRLIDILRHYLERRFAVKAMELTAAELSTKMKQNKAVAPYWNQALTEAVQQSALVKFAKAKPLAQENEAALEQVRNFVKQSQVKPEAEKHV